MGAFAKRNTACHSCVLIWDMDKITVNKKDDFEFEVTVGTGSTTTLHTVTVDENYWQKLTGGKIQPEKLVKKSFEFLLERESKESILSKFNLSVIQKYFTEYEEEIAS